MSPEGLTRVSAILAELARNPSLPAVSRDAIREGVEGRPEAHDEEVEMITIHAAHAATTERP